MKLKLCTLFILLMSIGGYTPRQTTIIRFGSQMQDQAIGHMTTRRPFAVSSYNPVTGVTFSQYGTTGPGGTTIYETVLP